MEVEREGKEPAEKAERAREGPEDELAAGAPPTRPDQFLSTLISAMEVATTNVILFARRSLLALGIIT